MDSGGAERVISSLANAFFEFGHDVSIIMLAKRASGSFYELSNGVQLIGLTSKYKREPSFFKKASILKKEILDNQPDVVVSFLSYVCIYTWWALRKTKIPYVVSERNDPNSRNNFKQLLLNKAFKKASGCVFQTSDAKDWYKNIPENKSTIIYNPVNLTCSTEVVTKTKKQILYVGRFSEQKNCQLLITTFLEFHKNHADYSLTLYGDGPLKNELVDLVECSDACGFIKILPSSKTWQNDELDSCMFVLPSKFEGMPNVLAEALCLGIPSVSTNCPIGGPKELKMLFPESLILCDKPTKSNLLEAMEQALSVQHRKPFIPKDLDKNSIAKKWVEFIEGAIKRK